MNDKLVQESMIEEFDRRFFDIPFGNSAFQNIKFVMEAQYTPERGYRAVGLRLADRINSLKEAEFSLRSKEIDIEELQHQLEDVNLDKFERKRKKVEVEKQNSSLSYTMKLVNDAAIEVATLWEAMKQFPEFTREQFESGEQQHFEIRLKRQVVGLSGAKDSLDIITENNNSFNNTLKYTKRKLIG